MAPAREEGVSADRQDDRSRNRGGRHDNSGRDQIHDASRSNGVTESDGAYEQKRGQKRKSYDQRGNDDRSKRQHTRSISPEIADQRRGGPPRTREPPKGPRGYTNGAGGQRGNYGGHTGSRRHDRDEMDIDDWRSKGKAKDEHPINRVTAAWIPDIQIEEDDELLQEVKQAMGFAGFKSSKNKKVPGNNKNYGVKKEKQTQYRQYMNRVGGFNRPLSPSRE
ncbi:U4/U6.U5 small nuclear ribonucleoprotein-like protein [Elsinoe fawcettii]|nr:U4/U6.U5 small nuclear ribonucleoprotein-like protein [Elsinoe fawcettii]